jgi:hypothetical protein
MYVTSRCTICGEQFTHYIFFHITEDPKLSGLCDYHWYRAQGLPVPPDVLRIWTRQKVQS